MLNITNITDLRQLYRYQLNFPSPQFLPADFESWKTSFWEDVDGEGRTLFATLRGQPGGCDLYSSGSSAGYWPGSTRALAKSFSSSAATEAEGSLARSLAAMALTAAAA